MIPDLKSNFLFDGGVGEVDDADNSISLTAPPLRSSLSNTLIEIMLMEDKRSMFGFYMESLFAAVVELSARCQVRQGRFGHIEVLEEAAGALLDRCRQRTLSAGLGAARPI